MLSLSQLRIICTLARQWPSRRGGSHYIVLGIAWWICQHLPVTYIHSTCLASRYIVPIITDRGKIQGTGYP